ncbi:MAG: DNA adenine methylase [Planctomycetes bacterium]|nr:DNA adenine methylase [Planctomycetota bacterium]
MRFQSPLRYPGGKASLSGLLEDTIDLNNLRGTSYYEPFAGGAGAALTLLERGVVSELFLNDLDARVFAFWRATINQTSQMIERTMSVPLTIKEWKKQRAICRTPSRHSQIDVGFAAFYMNRCNRSGILTGAGPIGGLKQSGKWRLDVRFYRESLAERLDSIGRNRNRIFVSRLDSIEFLKTALPRGLKRRKAFVYLDPPYVVKGQRLYLNAYDQQDHARLASYLCKQNILPWFMSYDDTPLVRELYKKNTLSTLTIDYKLHQKRSAEELIITPPGLATPSSCRIAGQDRQLVSVA